MKPKIGDRLYYRFGGPGPDITEIEVIGINDDGSFYARDVHFPGGPQHLHITRDDMDKGRVWDHS